MKKRQQQRSWTVGLFASLIFVLILLMSAGLSMGKGRADAGLIPYPPFNVNKVMTEPKDGLILAYECLKGKYLQQRDLADCLTEPILGDTEWRDHLGDIEPIVGKFDAFRCTVFLKHIPNISAELLDWTWHHLDQSHYMQWSVYHYSWEWLTPPNEDWTTGPFKVAWQDVPGRGMGPAFAIFSPAEPFVALPLEYDYAMLMRFHEYDPVEKKFSPAIAILFEWSAAPDGGVDTCTKFVALGAPGCEEFVVGDQSVEAPHEWEEINSWLMGAQDLARRKSFDPSTYTPVFKVGGVKHRKFKQDSDPGNVKVFSSEELQEMDIGAIQRAYDALWQKYLAQKILADYLLHYYADHPEYEPPDCWEIYNNYFIPET